MTFSQLLVHGRDRVRALSWSHLLGLVFNVAVVSIVLSTGAAPETFREHIKPFGKSIIVALLLAKLMTLRYQGLERWRAVRNKGVGWNGQARALIPFVLVAWISTDRANVIAFLQWLRRRPLPLPPAGRAFGFLTRSNYSTIFLIVLVAILVELPMDGLIASVISKTPEQRMWIKVILPTIAIYSLVWMLGDRRQLQCGYQLIDANTLRLEVGARLSACIPLSAIEHSARISCSVAHWCSENQVPRQTTVLATPADGPNVVIRIADSTDTRIRLWHVERDAPRYLFLFADDPALLVLVLEQGTQSR